MTPDVEKVLGRHFTAYLDSRRSIDSLMREGKVDIAEATEKHTDAWMMLTTALTDEFVAELVRAFKVTPRRVGGES